MPVLRMFPLNTVVFPGQDIPLHIFEPRYQQLVKEVLDQDDEFGIALIREGRAEGGGAIPVEVGCAVRIVEADELPGGRWEILCRGTRRFRIDQSLGEDPYLRCDVTFLNRPTDTGSDETAKAMSEVRAAYSVHLRFALGLVDSWQRNFPLPADPVDLADLVAARLEIPPAVKQEILESPEVARRLEMLVKVLHVENAQLRGRLEAHRRSRYGGLGILN